MLHVGVGRRNAQNVNALMSAGIFPVVSDVNTGIDDTVGNTTATINLPANIAVGDLLLIFGAFNSGTNNFAIAGWTTLLAGVSNNRIPSAFRIATGAEGATVSASWTTSTQNRWVAWRIPAATWNGVTPPEVSTAGPTSSTSPNPPILSPSWGLSSTLWIAAMGSAVVANTITAFPLNYNDNQTARVNGDVTGAHLGLATRNLAALSEDPGTFTITSAAWFAATFAVRGK